MVITKFPLKDFSINLQHEDAVTEEMQLHNEEINENDNDAKKCEAKHALQYVFDQKSSQDEAAVKILDGSEFVKYSKEEIDLLKSMAVEDGMKIAKLEYEKDQYKIQEKNAQLLSEIKLQINKLEPVIVEQYKRLVEDLGELVNFLLQKVVGVVTQRFSKNLIIDFLRVNLSTICSEPLITIKVNSQDYEYIKDYIKEIESISSENTKITLVSTDDVMLGDCIIDFDKGVISRDTTALLTELEKVLNNYFAHKSFINN